MRCTVCHPWRDPGAGPRGSLRAEAERGRAVARERGFQRLGEHRLLVLGVVAVPRGTEDGSADLEGMGLPDPSPVVVGGRPRSEANTSGLQSLMRVSYAVFCL